MHSPSNHISENPPPFMRSNEPVKNPAARLFFCPSCTSAISIKRQIQYSGSTSAISSSSGLLIPRILKTGHASKLSSFCHPDLATPGMRCKEIDIFPDSLYRSDIALPPCNILPHADLPGTMRNRNLHVFAIQIRNLPDIFLIAATYQNGSRPQINRPRPLNRNKPA